jgi:mycoredoxin
LVRDWPAIASVSHTNPTPTSGDTQGKKTARDFQVSEKILLYGKPTCPMVPGARFALERAEAEYEYVNILSDPEARSRVQEINNGNESVPTLEFPDGSSLTEPSSREIEDKLRSLGYEIPSAGFAQRLRALFFHPLTIYVGLLLVVVAAITGNNLLLAVGLLIIVLRSLTNWLAGRTSTASTPKTTGD